VKGSQQSPDQFDLIHYLDNKRDLINRFLLQIIDEYFDDSRLCHAMKYSLMAPGKRLRPVLCLAAAETVGKIDSNVITAACGIEMIHTYSLIHDDLPAMDNDDMRRGKPTCHIEFDVATAILAGDALLTLAFEIFSSKSLNSNKNSKIWLQVINTIAKAVGYRGMIEGQMRDIAAEKNNLDLDDLKKMHHLKTGALIEASVTAGALLGGGGSITSSIRQLEIYASNIGLAFQVIDDILNVEGDPSKTGKASGTDQLRNKSTYPALLGLAQSKQFASELINNALQALTIFGNKANPLSALAKYIIERKH
jgi:geranylgeranyl diphosphate synthase type II